MISPLPAGRQVTPTARKPGWRFARSERLSSRFTGGVYRKMEQAT